jgi:hypothetical protein
MSTTAHLRIPVPKRTLVVRVRRKLRSQDEGMIALYAARDQNTSLGVRDFYLVDARINGVVCPRIDLESYARELGVLKPHEYLQDDPEPEEAR